MGKLLNALFVLAAATATAHADDAKSLIAEGATLQNEGEWAKARQVYERLEQVKGHEGLALYLQASSAANTGNYDEARDLVMQSVMHPGKHATAARLLYADLWFRHGDIERARRFYEHLRPTVDAATKAIIDKRLAALAPAKEPSTSTSSSTATTSAPSTGVAYYTQAREAFDRAEFQLALELAHKAATTGGTPKNDARILYTDCLFKLGDYKRAKDLYIAIHRMTAGAVQKKVESKLAMTNRALQLPDRDGL